MRPICRGPSGVCGTFQISSFGETVQLLRNRGKYTLRVNGDSKEIPSETAERLLRTKGRREEYIPIVYPFLYEELPLDPLYLEFARRGVYGRH